MNPAAIEKRLAVLESVAMPPVVVVVRCDQTREGAIAEYERVHGPIIWDNITYLMIRYENIPADDIR